MAITYKLTGLDQVVKDLQNNLERTFNTKLEEVVKDYLESQIAAQVDANQNPMPKKSPQTIKEYTKQGWNINKFLVRTGDSTKLKFTKSGNKMVVTPEGADILKTLIPSRVTWCTLNDSAIKSISDVFLKELVKEFK